MRLGPDKAPSISYMEGALLYFARRGAIANADTPGRAKMSARVNDPLDSGGGADLRGGGLGVGHRYERPGERGCLYV